MPEEELEAKINALYKPTDKEQELRKWVYKRKREMEDAPDRQNAEKAWEKGERAWEAHRSDRDADEWQSNYYIPLTTSVIESILAEMVDQRLRPLILPRGPEDTAKAMVMRHAFDYTWDVANGDDELADIFKSCLIRGDGFAQEYYLKDRRLVRDIVGISAKSKKTQKRDVLSEEREVFEFDDCMMENVSNWDLFFDEKAREVNRGPYKARDAIRRYIMNYRDAKIFFHGPIWNHMGNFRFVKPGGDTDYYQYFKPPQGIDHGEEVEVLWYWSRKPEDLLVIVVNDVVVRMGPNIFKHKQLPFAKAADVTRVDKFYNKGEPELLESIQDELNTLRRMVIDRNHLDIDKSFLVSQNSLLDDDDLIARPHMAIPVDDPKSVQALEYGDIPLSVERTLKAITEDSIRVTGVDDRFQSLQKTPSTATEAAILKESTLKRIRMKIRNIEKGFLTDIARMRVANILQFYSQPKLEKIIGEAKTQSFQREMAKAAQQGMLEVRDGQPFKKKFKEIRTEGIELFTDERGQVNERKKPGVSFFELKPEFFMPVSRGGFDIRYEAGANLPVSKPLMQSKVSEMYDRILPIAVEGVTAYDPEKLGDELVKVNDLNPQDLKREEAVQAESIEGNRLEMAVELASQENQSVLENKPIPEFGTPYAPPAHTQVHIEFIRSDSIQVGTEPFTRLLQHVTGEMEAIKARGGEQTSPPVGQAGQSSVASPSSPFPASATGMGQSPTPSVIRGGGQVPEGRAIGNG